MIVRDSAAPLKRFLALTGLKDTALAMVQRVVVAFLLHTGRKIPHPHRRHDGQPVGEADPEYVVKILMTNNLKLSLREIIELESLRWQIELFFKELKSTLGFDQYRFQSFQAVEAWVNLAFTTVLFLEQQRAKRLGDRRLSDDQRRWRGPQRLHG